MIGNVLDSSGTTIGMNSIPAFLELPINVDFNYYLLFENIIIFKLILLLLFEPSTDFYTGLCYPLMKIVLGKQYMAKNEYYAKK